MSLPGADNTDGDLVDVGVLVAKKSIQITGDYEGQFIILGSHDGVHFVPLLTFNSGAGPNSFKRTMCFIVRYLKVRRRAPISNVTAIIIAASFQCESSAGSGGSDDSADNLSIIAFLNAGINGVPNISTITPGDEFILGAPTGSFTQTVLTGPAYIPMQWEFPGAQIRAGIKGVFTVTDHPVVINLYVGGAPASGDRVPEGTLVHSFTIPVGASQLIEEISPLFTQPVTSPSYFQIAGRNDFGTNLTVAAANGAFTPFIQLESGQSDLYAGMGSQAVITANSLSERLIATYLVDLDEINDLNIEVRFAGRLYQTAGTTLTFRSRLGGAIDTVDGTIIASVVSAVGSQPDGRLVSMSAASVANPGGKVLLKLTGQITAGLITATITEHTFSVRGI